MKPLSVLYVSADVPAPLPWDASWGNLRAAVPGGVADALAGGPADVALVDGGMRHALPAVREVHGADPALQPILLVGAADRGRVQRALLFEPGVGETWIAAREELDEALLRRAASVTGKRRSFRALQRRIADTVVGGEDRDVRPYVTDAYLAALLQVLPDPTAAIDDQGRVLYWSPAAAELLGTPAERAIGQPFDALVGTAGTEWGELLRRSADGPLRVEVQYLAANGEARTAVLGLAPITIGSQRARAAILHDVTEARRAQERLAEQTERLERQAVELTALASEKDQLLLEREHTLGELRRAMDVRTRFYASMNHEIRTPINAMLGYTDLLLSGTYGELTAPQLRALEQSRRAAQHLIELVNDLLDLARVEAGRTELQVAPVRMADLIRDLLASARPQAQAHGCELLPEASECPPSIITDPRRVRQILLNLVSNAIKFGEGKPVSIRCAGRPGGGIIVEVEDHGIGIAEADQARIFEEFVQVSGRSIGGVGLGLPISRRLATALGGSLAVRSRLGEGSTFRLELPARPPMTGE